MTGGLRDRYDARISGVLSCYDRVVITGTLPTVCYAAGMTRFLHVKQVRIFDYPAFAATLREKVRERAASLAAEAGITIEHIAKNHIRKEAVVAKVLERRGEHPGLVHVISAMEACNAYQPWHDKQTHKTSVRPDSGKCLHYYFYVMDGELGLVYLRVPTWAPFRLQFYCNGHSWLARRLAAEGIGFTAADNAFVHIDDWQRAQELADKLSPDRLHRVLDRYAALCCPVLDTFGQSYHWSLMQVEYATDLVFRSAATLKPLYDQLARESVLSVRACPGEGRGPSRSLPFSAARSPRSWPRTWAVSSPPGSKGPASSTASAAPRSRCTTRSAACCASRPRPTTCPSSSTTARWNIGRGRPRGRWPPSRKPSTA